MTEHNLLETSSLKYIFIYISGGDQAAFMKRVIQILASLSLYINK